MKSLLVPAVFGLALLATPAFAHMGLQHEGCAAGQVFTAGDLTISGAFTRATLPKASVGGGYLTIENKGTTPDRLIGGSSENARTVEVHRMQMEGDMMRMSKVEGGVEIPAGGTAALEPGGYHLMILDLVEQLITGECIDITLQFEKAGAVPVQFNIGGLAAKTAPEGAMEGMNHDNMMMAPAQ